MNARVPRLGPVQDTGLHRCSTKETQHEYIGKGHHEERSRHEAAVAREGRGIAEVEKATGWQPHSCRAFLTGLRKKSRIVKQQRGDGKLAYRIEVAPTEAVPAL